ncbi:MAG: Trm112 family protein [Armatimonadetes bacterium]|nr:Trm112 family protein [Armatimonadota bacterium]
MKLDSLMLEILRCPETQQELTLADDALLEKLNAAVAAGNLTNRGGESVNEPIDGALVRSAGDVAYPIRDEIPEMLIESGIELAPFA